jgi:hypothetical protein
MNQTASQAAPHEILPLKDRPGAKASGTAVNASATTKPKKKVVKRPDANLVAALKAGLPRSIAEALAKRPVVVVELWSSTDSVGKLSAGEAKQGAALAGAAFVGIDVDADGGAAGVLTAALGKMQQSPSALIYTRPATLSGTLAGFNDRTAVQQAVLTAGAKTSASAT